MHTSICVHGDRCDLCGGTPECVPACPQQILTVRGDGVVMSHENRCPNDCTVCIDSCGSEVFALVEEVHQGLGQVPGERIGGACLVHHVAYQRDDDETEDSLRSRFEGLLDSLGIRASQRSLGDAHAHGWGKLKGADGVTVQLTWELHTEYYFVRAILSEVNVTPETSVVTKTDVVTETNVKRLDAPMEALIPALHSIGNPPLVTCLDIVVIDRPLNPDEVCQKIVCRNRFGNRVLGGDLAVYTNYEPVNGRECYVVCGTPKAVASHGAFAVANIGRIENYYHLLMIPRTEERGAIAEVHRMEEALSTRTEAVTVEISRATPARMETWLEEMTVELAMLVRLNGRFNHVLSATFPYGERVRDGFGAWKATPVDSFDPLDEMILTRVELVVEEYHAFLTRLGRMQSEIQALVSILRTRVEMSMEAQNSEMLKNLDERSAIQLRLQELAEGLSVIVITYYMTGLAGYMFKALEKKHWIGDGMGTVFTAIFIPIAAFTAYTMAHRAVRKIKKETGNGH